MLSFADNGRSTLLFSSLKNFLNFKGDEQFNSIIISLSCVRIKAKLDTSDEIGPLVEFVNQLEIQKKHLIIETPVLKNYTVLQDNIMTYNVGIYHDGRFIFKNIPFIKIFQKKFSSRWENDITLPYPRKEICIDISWHLSSPSATACK